MVSVFISHTHGDKPLADALSRLIKSLFDGRIAVHYSSNRDLDEGIAPGEDWGQWIVNQVRSTDMALILMTPASIQKPWLIWEAGAVAGAAIAISEKNNRVVPIAFGVSSSEVPSPFARTQIVDGREKEGISRLMDSFFSILEIKSSENSYIITNDYSRRFERCKNSDIEEYILSLEKILCRLPLPLTEGYIMEWISRIDQFKADGRYSETQVLEDWVDMTFGRDRDKQSRPLDSRLHRRLGEMYEAHKQASDAARQFELARKLAPRDIFILRSLGKAYLDGEQWELARGILDLIEELDSKAFHRNAENAALKARWLVSQGDRSGAIQLLREAYAQCPNSYYIGDRLGQLLIDARDIASAREIYKDVEEKIISSKEKNIWANATLLSAALVLDNERGVESAINSIIDCGPTQAEASSICRGVDGIQRNIGKVFRAIDKLKVMGTQ